MKVAEQTTLYEAAQAHREPFVFSRCEITPELKRSLARDYKKFGKPLMLAPHGLDGVYPKEAFWLIPKGVGESWIRKHLAPLIATTNLFGAQARERVFFHSGDLGDIIACLPTIRQLGGGRIVIGHVPSVRNRETMKGKRFEIIKPLLEAQPYVSGVEYDDAPPYVTHDMSTFRHDVIRGESLAKWQARHIGITDLDLSPWLTVPKVVPNGLVVMARTLRYQSQFFPWPAVVHHYRGRAVFVGLPEEFEVFRRRAAALQKIEHRPTRDLLELAELIAGCSRFVGNQSVPFWIAVGLGVPLIQETWEYDQNSIVPRENAIYTRNWREAKLLPHKLRTEREPLRVA